VLETPFDPRVVEVAAMRTLRVRIGPDARHVLQLDAGFRSRPHLHADRLVPGLPAVRRALHPNAVATGTVAPVRRCAVLLDREKRIEEVALVVKSQGRVATGLSAFTGGIYGGKGFTRVAGVGDETAAGSGGDLIGPVLIDRDRRLCPRLAVGGDGDDARSGRAW